MVQVQYTTGNRTSSFAGLYKPRHMLLFSCTGMIYGCCIQDLCSTTELLFVPKNIFLLAYEIIYSKCLLWIPKKETVIFINLSWIRFKNFLFVIMFKNIVMQQQQCRHFWFMVYIEHNFYIFLLFADMHLTKVKCHNKMFHLHLGQNICFVTVIS